MPSFDREEIERAFHVYWRAGAVGEDWDAWAERFTEDADYVEHVLGNLKGREAIRGWIKPIMQQYPELYTAYEWHTIDADAGRVIVYMQNRRDHPSGQGTIDFPGVTILDYGGGGLWKREEDFWAVPTAYRVRAAARWRSQRGGCWTDRSRCPARCRRRSRLATCARRSSTPSGCTVWRIPALGPGYSG